MASSDKAIIELVEQIIQHLQSDENRFYVELDLAHHLLEQLLLTVEQESNIE